MRGKTKARSRDAKKIPEEAEHSPNGSSGREGRQVTRADTAGEGGEEAIEVLRLRLCRTHRIPGQGSEEAFQGLPVIKVTKPSTNPITHSP